MDPPLRGRWDLKGDREMEALRERAAAAQRSVRRLMERQQGSSKHYRAHCSQRRNTNSQTGKKSQAVSGVCCKTGAFLIDKILQPNVTRVLWTGGTWYCTMFGGLTDVLISANDRTIPFSTCERPFQSQITEQESWFFLFSWRTWRPLTRSGVDMQ